MKWLGKQLRERHTTLNRWCSSSHTHTTPRKMLTQYQHALLYGCVRRNPQYVRTKSDTRKFFCGNKWKLSSQKWPSFPLLFLLLLLLPPFTVNGDRGDRWRELLILLPPLPAPLLHLPLPWCLCLNYISALASTATLFTHSSIHIHLACTCLVPARVT